MFNSKTKTNKIYPNYIDLLVLNSYLYYISLDGLCSSPTNFKWLNFIGENPIGKGMVRAHLIEVFKK
jgi:hypothetical protein